MEKPRVLLITGFEPFGGQIVNPSWESVRALLDRIGPWQLVKMRLPVVFGRAARQVIQRAEEIKPQAVLCVGQAGGRSALTPEMVGINLRHGAQPDNEGALLQDAPIDPDAPAAYFATVPVRAMARAIQEAGLPGQVSYSAGTFVCNDVLFSLLRHFDGKKGIACGFVHVPYQTGQGEPSMPPADIARALTAAIQAL
ncbi:MAG: pyroglutamyl-peptidase I [Clostridia bacterium]|nr:pyroglutamyl-peptidase I [Clostridia bacterium]